MKINISYNGQTISVPDGKTATLKCAGLKANSDIVLSAVAEEPINLQELTVMNTISETQAYTMPSGYTFSELVSSSYNTDGCFSVDNYSGYVYYFGILLWTLDENRNLVEATSSTIASGTFYYQGRQISGTWTFNETIDPMPCETSVSFYCDNKLYIGIERRDGGTDITYGFKHLSPNHNGAYYLPNGWLDEKYRTISFDGTQTVSEEFYEWVTSNAVRLTITFTIDGTSYTALEGMTWAEWCESEYNTGGFHSSHSTTYDAILIYGVRVNNRYVETVAYSNEELVRGEECIISNDAYQIKLESTTHSGGSND